ncbi:MAG: desulfoferrodoxin [Victivallaceae bacterium]|nr:desulfoferrodoxin [Victivallaceae bacterium]
MSKTLQVYKCPFCGLVVEVLGAGAHPVCCGEPMRLLEENSSDGAVEKHVPVVEKRDSGILVKVGSAPHPMEPEHYIEWIEVIDRNYVTRYHLKPGDAPQAAFSVGDNPNIVIRAYCNKHGLWKK